MGHPGLQERTQVLLWSINERLAGRDGVNVPELPDDWMLDAIRDGTKAFRLTAPLKNPFLAFGGSEED